MSIVGWTKCPTGPQENDKPVGKTFLQNKVGLVTLVKEKGVFMGLDSIEITVRILNSSGATINSTKSSDKFQNKTRLKEALAAEIIVS